MRIGIDACCWSNRRGFGRFTRGLVTALLEIAPPHEVTLVVDASTAEGASLPKGARLAVVKTSERPTRAASAAGARSPLDLWRLSRAASSGRFDVFLFPAVYSFYPLLRRIPTIVGFHDAIAEDYADLVFDRTRGRLFWKAKVWLARAQAHRVLTVSESARNDLVRAFKLARERVRVVSEGIDPVFRPHDDEQARGTVRARYGLPAREPLLLHVGGISPHKNLPGLVRALLEPEMRTSAWHLALVGDPGADGFLSDERALRAAIAAAGLERRITLTGFVPDADLALLYNAATMLVFPSLAEGFGLPALEAMACGLPVAASRRGALPEVLGDASLFFDPLDPREIAATARRLLDEPPLRRRLRDAGLERARAHTWAAAARRTLDLLVETARA